MKTALEKAREVSKNMHISGISVQGGSDIKNLISHYEEAITQLQAKESELIKLASKQAEDSGLWFDAVHITESYLQEALRKLHRLIEGEK